MDPTANLREQVELADEILEAGEFRMGDYCGLNDCDPTRLAELVLALHHWMQEGGHLPEQWKRSE